MMFWVLPHSVDSWADAKVSGKKPSPALKKGENFSPKSWSLPRNLGGAETQDLGQQ